VTGKEHHEGLFKAPSLRNVGLTYPYMHDGSIACDGAYESDPDACGRNALGKVIDHYQSGGKAHPTKDATLIRPFSLTAQERSDLIEFLMALTDQDFISRQSLSNPQPANPLFGP